MNNLDSMNNEDFNLLVFLIFSFSLTIYLVTEAIDTKKFIKKSRESFTRRKNLHEEFLFKNQDTRSIFYYFLETKSKLPENLHNVMLANSLNKDFYAESYINCIDTKTNNIKKNAVETFRSLNYK